VYYVRVYTNVRMCVCVCIDRVLVSAGDDGMVSLTHTSGVLLGNLIGDKHHHKVSHYYINE